MAAVEASVFIENLSTVRYYNAAPALTAPAVRIPVRSQEVWLDYDSIPTTPPVQTAWPGTTSGPVSGVSGIVMTAVSGSATVFESTLGRFGYIVPGSQTDRTYAYNPTLTDSHGVVVPYNPAVWVPDGLLGKITFTFGVPAGIVPPFTLNYWRYVGGFVAGGGGATLASTGGTESLVADGVGPTLTVRGLTAGAGVSLTGVVGNDITIAATTALSSAGGDATIVKSGGGPALVVKGLTAGVGVSLSGGTNDVTITNSSPASGVTLASAGGVVTLVQDGVGPSLAVLGLTAGTGISLSSSGTAVTVASTVTVASAGGSVSLVNTGAAPAYTTKGLTAGVGISFGDSATAVTVTNVSPATSVTLASAGGTQTLVKTGAGPDLVTRGLTAGYGVALTGNLNDITVATSHSIASAGGTTLLKDGVGPAFLTKGLTAGTGITLTGGTNDVTVALTTASLTLGSSAVALGATLASIAGLTALGAATITGTTGDFSSTLHCAALTADGLITANGGYAGTSASLSTTLSVTGTATLASPLIVGVSGNVGVTVAPAGPGSSGSVFGSFGSGPYQGSGINFAASVLLPTNNAGTPMTNGSISLGAGAYRWGGIYGVTGDFSSTLATTGSVVVGPSADVGVTVAPAASNASGCIFGSFGTPGLYVGSGIGFGSSKVIPTDRAGAPTTGTTSLGAALATWGAFYATTGTFSSTVGCTALTATTGSFSSTLGVTGLSTLTGGLVVGPSANVGIATVVPTSSASGGIYGSYGTGPYSGSGINFAASVLLPTDNTGAPKTDGSISLGASGYRWGGIYGVTGNYSSTLATTGSVVVGPSADVGVTVAPAASGSSGCIFGSFGTGPYTGSGIGFTTSKVIPTDRAGAPTNGTTSLGGSGATWGPFFATTGTFSSTLGCTALTATSGSFSTTLGVTGLSTLTGGLLVGPSADVGVTTTVATSSASAGIYGSFGSSGSYLGSGINFASSAVIPTTRAGASTNGTTTLGAANGYSWGTLYSTTGLFSTSVAAGPNTSTSTLAATAHSSTSTAGYSIATTNTFCGTGTWNGSSGSSCGPGFGGDITSGNSFIQACTLAGASPAFASSASLSLQPNGQTTIVGGILSVASTVSAPTYSLSYSSLATPPTSSQIGWSASVGSFTSPITAGATLTLLAKHTGVGVGVYMVSFLATLGGTSGGSGKFDFLLRAEQSGGTAVASAGPFTLCFDQITFVCADSRSGTWTYANNTANASFAIYGSSTAAVSVACSAVSYIQLTRIA